MLLILEKMYFTLLEEICFDFYLKDFIFNNSLSKTNYYPILILFLFSLILATIILVFSYILSVQNPETEKLSSYECGFEPFNDSRITFDVHFYIVAILFMIFDLEIAYLFP